MTNKNVTLKDIKDEYRGILYTTYKYLGLVFLLGSIIIYVYLWYVKEYDKPNILEEFGYGYGIFNTVLSLFLVYFVVFLLASIIAIPTLNKVQNRWYKDYIEVYIDGLELEKEYIQGYELSQDFFIKAKDAKFKKTDKFKGYQKYILTYMDGTKVCGVVEVYKDLSPNEKPYIEYQKLEESIYVVETKYIVKVDYGAGKYNVKLHIKNDRYI